MHIFKRSKRHTEDDPRYTAMAEKWKGRNYWLRAYLSIFLLQGVLILLVSAPVVAATGPRMPGFELLLDVGLVIWLVGYVIEYYADWQLAKFRANPANKGKVMSSGLWRYSRHPNYFGELTQWWGIGLIACEAAWGWVGLFGPSLLTILIVFVSGIPPIEKRKKDDPAYQAYKKRTSSLIPWLPKSI